MYTCGEYIPVACSEAASPILFVAQQPSVKIILDPTKRHKCLFHSTTISVTTGAVVSSLIGSQGKGSNHLKKSEEIYHHLFNEPIGLQRQILPLKESQNYMT